MIRAAAVVPVLLLLVTGGCVSTVAHVATAPVRIVGAGINTVVPGQRERDRRRGKRDRKAEEAQRKANRKAMNAQRKVDRNADAERN